MKIGTVTFYGVEDNYGCILQCFALPKYLNLLGHEAFFIKSRYDNSNETSSLPKRILNRIIPWIKSPIKTWEARKDAQIMEYNIRLRKQIALEHPRHFSQFMDAFIPSTKDVYNQNELIDNPPIADAYVCGSDQIWGGVNPTMYLRFAPAGTKKIAYAASFGGLVPNPQTLVYIKQSISDFDLVALREQSGVDLCKSKLGREDALLVPDPTLLLKVEEYKKVSKTTNPQIATERPFILLYLLGNTMSVSVDDIMQFASRNNLEVRYVASGGRIDDYQKVYPSVEEWLYLLENSSYVITNSFHGTIFSLLYNKKFMTIPLSGSYQRMNVRLTTLLNNLNLESRLYKGDFKVLFEEIDFAGFKSYQEKEISRVTNLLNKVLVK